MNLRLIVSSLALIVAVVAGLTARQAGPAQLAFEAARKAEVVDHDLRGAIDQYRALVSRYASDRAVMPEALFRLAGCYEQLGQPDARLTYERIVKDYPDSAPAAAARAKLNSLQRQGAGLTTTRLGTTSFGAPSPDGKYLTFADDETGDLAVRDLKSDKKRRLTTNSDNPWSQFSLFSVPSPDGRQIAYGWLLVGGKSMDLRVINLSGGTPRLLGHYEGATVMPVGWSKDSKEVFFCVYTGPRTAVTTQLLIVPATGGQPRVVKTVNGEVIGASWSPDGQFIAYDAQRTADKVEHGLFIMRTDGTNVMTLFANAANEQMLDWFPDGKRILFMSDRGGTNGMWAVGMADGKTVGEPIRVMPNVGRIFGLGFTRDGTYYYRSQAVLEDVLVFRLDGSGALSGNVEPLQGRFASGKQAAAWSRDGSQIAYTQQVPFGVPSWPSLSIQTISDGQIRTIPTQLMTVANPVWMPDGQEILVEGKTPQGEQGIFRIALRTGALSAVGETSTELSAQKGLPAVSLDGREVFYTVGRGVGGIQARDLVSGSVRTVLSDPVMSFALSPDGRFIAAGAPPPRSDTVRTPPVRIVPVAGGLPRALATELETGNPGAGIAWTADGRYVLFTRYSGPGMPLWRVPVDGGPAQRLSFQSRNIRMIQRVNVNPNGLVAVSTQQWINENWTMRNIPADIRR